MFYVNKYFTCGSSSICKRALRQPARTVLRQLLNVFAGGGLARVHSSAGANLIEPFINFQVLLSTY